MILRKADTTKALVIWSILQQAIEQRKQDGRMTISIYKSLYLTTHK